MCSRWPDRVYGELLTLSNAVALLLGWGGARSGRPLSEWRHHVQVLSWRTSRGVSGIRTPRSGNGAPFAKITVKTEMHGTCFRTITPGHALVAGARMAWAGSRGRRMAARRSDRRRGLCPRWPRPEHGPVLPGRGHGRRRCSYGPRHLLWDREAGLDIHDTSSLLAPTFHRSEVVGFLAGFGTTFAAVPDPVGMFRRRSSKGISPTMASSGCFRLAGSMTAS